MSHIRGRFEKNADMKAEQYTASIQYDWRLKTGYHLPAGRRNYH